MGGRGARSSNTNKVTANELVQTWEKAINERRNENVGRELEKYDRQVKEALRYNPYARREELIKVRDSIKKSKILTEKDKKFLINTFYANTFETFI